MNYRELVNSTKIEVEGTAKVDGVEIPADVIVTTLYGRIWNSAQVVKNKREAVNTSIKATIGQALKMELITPEEGLQILLVGDKAKVAELRGQMPEVQKSKEPLAEDIEAGKQQFLANAGQRA